MAEPQPSPEVEEHESIARYCRHKSDMRPGEGKSHYRLLLPPANMRMSVVRSSGLDVAEVEAIGRALAAATIKGHVTLAALTIFSHELEISPDPPAHPRHANVVGWTGVEEQDRAKAIALAEASSLTRY